MDLYVSLLQSQTMLWLAFFALEILWPADRALPVRSIVRNLAYYVVGLAALLKLQDVAGPWFGALLASCGGGLMPNLISPPKTLLGHLAFGVAFAVTWDIWQYWMHRWQHTSAILWQTHRFHHTDTALNATSQGRNHLLHHALFLIGFVPVLLFWGGMTPHAFAVFLMFRVWGLVNHANVRLNLGRATPWIAGPQWHRIHHSVEPAHRDRNFATFFPFIDKWFGTYYEPKRGEFPATGLTGGDDEGDLVSATTGPLLAWYRSVARWWEASRPAIDAKT